MTGIRGIYRPPSLYWWYLYMGLINTPGPKMTRGNFFAFSGESHFSPTAESFGVSAQIGSGVVRGGGEVRFHEGSTEVPPGSARAARWSGVV